MRAFIITVVIGTSIVSAPVFAADDAKDRYKTEMTCASAITAAVDQKVLPTTITRGQATSLRDVYIKQALNTGHETGFSAVNVTNDIEGLREAIVTKMIDPDPVRARTERAETSKLTTDCAALFGFSLLTTAAPQATP